MTPVSETAQRARTTLIAFPLGIYALSRLVQLVLLWWMSPDDKIRDRLLAWDGGHFVRVAEEGYPTGYSYDAEGHLTGNGLAFFPGYPLTVRLVHYLTRLEYGTSAITVSWIAGGVAAVLLCALGTRLYDERVGLALTALFCVQPMSLALSMGYSEALFTAFVVGMLLCAHRGAWIAAGVLGLGAGLTRPTGAAAAIALVVAAAIAVYNQRTKLKNSALHEPALPAPATQRPVPERAERDATADVAAERSAEDDAEPRSTASTREGVWKPILGAVIALVGVPAYLLWVGLRVGDLGAWFDIQTAGWGTTFDYGDSTLTFLHDAFKAGDGWIQVSIAWMLLAVVALAVIALVRRVWAPLAVYGLIVLVLVLGQAGYYHSKPRLLVPALLILVPPAVALGRARARTAGLVLAACGAFGLWYGSYLITVWHYAI
ncbi:mannosyltransferase family protein [Dactylosporangium sp. NPDC051541]|uniref:mannosyltransferase family protein n=1 Tax=Dactylosporangium sp. NPDC051541 TaxID=3363977 RepID=UPI00379951A0